MNHVFGLLQGDVPFWSNRPSVKWTFAFAYLTNMPLDYWGFKLMGLWNNVVRTWVLLFINVRKKT